MKIENLNDFPLEILSIISTKVNNPLLSCVSQNFFIANNEGMFRTIFYQIIGQLSQEFTSPTVQKIISSTKHLLSQEPSYSNILKNLKDLLFIHSSTTNQKTLIVELASEIQVNEDAVLSLLWDIVKNKLNITPV